MTCYVCESTVTIHEHHIIPQAKGGTEGPTVPLCSNCHGMIHTVAKSMQRGKSGDDKMAHLDEDAVSRARTLVQMILLANVDDSTNPNPLISAVLDSPSYLVALKKYQRDIGASSQEVAINVIFRSLAVKYGLVEESNASRVQSRVKLKEISLKS